MNRILKYMILGCLAVSLFTSCEEVVIDEPTNEQVVLRVPVTRGGGDVEIDIDRAHIFVFNRMGENLVARTYKEGDNITFTELVPTGLIDIYLVANELPEWNLASVTTVDQLKSKLMNFSAYPIVTDANPIPMVGIYERVTLKADGTLIKNNTSLVLTTGGTVERLFAKVTLDIKCLYKDLPGNTPTVINTMKLESISIKHMPKKAWLLPASYTPAGSGDFFDGVSAVMTGVNYIGNASDPSTYGFNAKFTFYVPEHIVNDVRKYTYLSVEGCLFENQNVKMRYKLPIGDGIATKTNTQMLDGKSIVLREYNVVRNTWYGFNITAIKGFGEMDGIDVFTTVRPWGSTEVPNDVTERKLNVSEIVRNLNDIAPSRLYFWSNQEDVRVEVNGYTDATGTTSYAVNSFFNSIAGVSPTNFHYSYNSTTKEGTGYIDLSTIHTEVGTYVRRIILNANGLKREVTINAEVLNLPTWFNGTGGSRFVGTLHKLSQKGERLLYGRHTGPWTAEVEDPSGAGSFVVLSSDMTKDPDFYTKTPGDPEMYPVTGNLKKVTGLNFIFFRVGLTGASPSPRYARIKVTHQRLDGVTPEVSYVYVRQGDQPLDIVGDGIEWSTYNLSDPKRGNGGLNMTDHNEIVPHDQVKSTSFSDIASGSGYLFLWNTQASKSAVHAWKPNQTNGVNDQIANWPSSYYATQWDDAQDPCPVGYRTPTEEECSANGGTTGLLRTSPKKNFVIGCYADGKYDRTAKGTPREWHIYSDYDVLTTGHLVFNETNNRSVFLPLAAHRSGWGIYSLISGKYFIKPTDANNKYRIFEINLNSVLRFDSYQSYFAFPVRCVLDH